MGLPVEKWPSTVYKSIPMVVGGQWGGEGQEDGRIYGGRDMIAVCYEKDFLYVTY